MRLFLFFLALVCLTQSAYASGSAGQSKYPVWLSNILPGIFPADAGKPQPHDTLKAPFADKPFTRAQPIDLPTLSTPLNQPHRSPDDIAQFALDVVSETLSFQSGEEAQHFSEVKNYYSEFGFQDLQKFLTTSNISPSMQGHSLQLSSISNAKPQLRSEGDVGGAYKWLYDVPVTITLMPQGVTSYNQAKKDITARDLILRLQITRSSQGQRDGLLVERFILAPS